MNEELVYLLGDLSYVVLGLFMLLISKVTLDWFTPFKVDDQLSAKDNPAFGLSLIGYYLGVLIVCIGAFYGDESALDAEAGFLATVGLDGAWALGGILLLNVARVITDRVVLRRFSSRKEIVDDQNVGMGAVEFGVYVASGLVVAGAISGGEAAVVAQAAAEGEAAAAAPWHHHPIVTALAFFGLGQVALIAYAFVYQLITGYDFHDELERDNAAAGVAYGGNLVAMGILMLRGTGGTFLSWGENLATFAWYLVAAFVLLVVGHFVVDALLMPGRTLHEEISEDRNVNAGYLEGGVLLGFAAVIIFTL